MRNPSTHSNPKIYPHNNNLQHVNGVIGSQTTFNVCLSRQEYLFLSVLHYILCFLVERPIQSKIISWSVHNIIVNEQ